jgi:pimeloyl-ACP methyl ester carboxylesterase
MTIDAAAMPWQYPEKRANPRPHPQHKRRSDIAYADVEPSAWDVMGATTRRKRGGIRYDRFTTAHGGTGGLVYLAAFGLEAGESCASVQEPFPPPLLATTARPTPYDAPGAAGGPDLYISKDRFRETFCADVPVDQADVMYATQRPLAAAALAEQATAAGWKDRPTWFLVSEHDNAIPPDAERFMAERMKATTDSVNGSHTAFIAQPVLVASFIKKALTA